MNKTDYIIKYFEGTLSEVELKAFNTLLENDPDFKKEVAFEQEVQDTLVLNDREKVKKEMQDWDTPKSKPHIRKNNFAPWKIAASLILLIGISWLLFFYTQSTSTAELYASNFEPYRNVVQPIVRGEDKEDIQSKAFKAYESKDYKNAIVFFDQILQEDPSTTISFYKANTLLQLNKTSEAITLLETTVKSADTFQDRALWYLALAYLKEDNVDASKKTLKQLIAQSKFKSKEATALIKQLD